jgi:threonine dehydratase
MENIPDYQDVVDAAAQLDGIVKKTPLIENPILNEITGANVFIKPENLQLTGSFKIRGAYNAISRLSGTQKASGVVACSSGNHAQGVAEAARLLGVSATIIMPEDSPLIKLERTRRSGAVIVTYQRSKDDRDKIAEQICAESGAILIHPYNNPHVIAGQGTTGLEIAQQLNAASDGTSPGQNPVLDRALVCTGGGGLICGVGLTLSHHFPDIKIHSVEPEKFDDYRRSLIKGQRVENPAASGSICDALLTGKPGKIGFGINKNLLAEGLVVSDKEALDAVRFAFAELKLVIEPGGAVALAALMKARRKWAGETIVCILTGGNIDADMMANAFSQ